MEIEKIVDLLTGGLKESRLEGFYKFLGEKLSGLYNEYLMNLETIGKEEISRWRFDLPNAKENVQYEKEINVLPFNSQLLSDIDVKFVDVKGLSLEKHGLKAEILEDGRKIRISGMPDLEYFRQNGGVADSTFELVISYKLLGLDLPEERPDLDLKVPFVINQDPRKLWKNLMVDWENMPEPKYINDDSQVDYVKAEALEDGTRQKDIVAASQRGRSHAQEAKPRDDHFKMHYDKDSKWYVMAVADGAGSARFSREGSRIACETVVDYCKSQLEHNADFETAIDTYNEYKDASESDARKLVGDYIYQIVGNAAYRAQKAIYTEANTQGLNAKLYATTLLLTICKKFSYGWFVASFWVGDGAICLYNKEDHTAKLLGVPDEGEYAGQTRFLTMPEIFKDATALYQRLRFYIVPDFTALFLMSDGVSDPKFETDANLNNPVKWDALWADLINNSEHPVDLSDDHEESKNELLSWLDFWSPGNHDDRTIAILY